MAIVDYATLQASIGNWLARADLASAIPDFIRLGESRINRDLKLRRMQSVVAGAAAAGVIPLPADFSGAISLRVQFSGGSYEIFPLTSASTPTYTVQSGLPLGYTVVSNNILLSSGQADIPYTLIYWAKIPSLSDSVQQTWLLTDEPGIYLYAALVEASPYVQDDERTLVWATQYKAVVDQLTRADEDERFGNAPGKKVRGATP